MPSDIRFDGQVVIVTGAGRGLGGSHAIEFARRGASVLVNDLGGGPLGSEGTADRSVAEAVAAEIRSSGGRAVASTADIVTGADEVVGRAVDEWGRVDAVVNNAGIVGFGRFTERPPAMFDTMFRVHALGTVNLTRAAWPHLAAVGGRVVNTTSGAVVGLPEQTDYATAKGAVLGFTRTAAIDGAQDGIRVNAVMPVAQTRMWTVDHDESEVEAMGVVLPPTAVSPVVVWLAHESVACTGQVFEAAGGYASRMALAFGAPVRGAAAEDFAAQSDALLRTDHLQEFTHLDQLLAGRLAAIAGVAEADGYPAS